MANQPDEIAQRMPGEWPDEIAGGDDAGRQHAVRPAASCGHQPEEEDDDGTVDAGRRDVNVRLDHVVDVARDDLVLERVAGGVQLQLELALSARITRRNLIVAAKVRVEILRGGSDDARGRSGQRR